MTYQVQNSLKGNAIYVDAVNGVDASGASGKADLPFLTIGAALAVASAGDTVQVLPGTYAESGLTIPASVSLVGVGGYEVTSITGAAVTGTRVNMSVNSTLANITLTIPTDALGAIDCTIGGGNVCGVRFLKFVGAGGLGTGITVSSGKLIGLELRQGAGTAGGMLNVLGGVLAAQAIHIPPGASLAFGAAVSGGGRLQCLDFNIGSSTVSIGVLCGAGTAVLISLNLFNCSTGIQIADNTASVEAYGGKIQASTYNLVVAPGLTGVGGLTRITAQMDRKFSIPATWIDSDHGWTFFTSEDEFDESSFQLWGANSVTGHPEKGSALYVGEGSAYGTNNTVFTTDTTGAAGYVDVSTAASSKSGSTFTFQTAGAGAVGETIMWCTNREDASAAKLKHWTAQFVQTTAASGGSFVFEIYSGAAWVAVGVQAIQVANQYRYADQIFLRASSTEDLRMGIDGTTTWVASAINGVTGHWARVRIATLPTTAPVFEQLKLVPSQFGVNKRGQMLAQGLAQWRQTLFGSGNMWGEGAGAKDYTVGVGTAIAAASLTGWDHKVKKGRMDTLDDFITFQFNVPGGLCTAFPLRFNATYSFTGAQAGIDLACCLIKQPVEGVLIADSAGGATPVARTLAQTPAYDTVAALNTTETLSTTADKTQVVSYNFDVGELYEGDLLIMKLHMVTNHDIDIWSLQVEGVAFSPGKVIS